MNKDTEYLQRCIDDPKPLGTPQNELAHDTQKYNETSHLMDAVGCKPNYILWHCNILCCCVISKFNVVFCLTDGCQFRRVRGCGRYIELDSNLYKPSLSFTHNGKYSGWKCPLRWGGIRIFQNMKYREEIRPCVIAVLQFLDTFWLFLDIFCYFKYTKKLCRFYQKFAAKTGKKQDLAEPGEEK